jgi:Caspase domain
MLDSCLIYPQKKHLFRGRQRIIWRIATSFLATIACILPPSATADYSSGEAADDEYGGSSQVPPDMHHDWDGRNHKATQNKQLKETKQILNPARTRLFAVGILKFDDNISFGAENRRDTQIVSLFRHRGVPEDQIDFIKDRDGTISNIKSHFGSFLQRTQPGDFLIHYYTGHGGVGSFETTNDGSYKHAWIAGEIDKEFKGGQVLLLGDCCESGSLEDVVDEAVGPIAYACISSSSRRETGHGNWTFSQAVLDGLRGEAYVDLNKDGYITIDELAKHVRHDILAYENNHSVYHKSPNFDGQMVIAIRSPKNNPSPEPVEVWYEGQWWTAKLMERSGDRARIRWIELGYDSPSQDTWFSLDNIRTLN